ncbi:MAG TPA: single-stranded-DNA-specific exonuclease RecJ [Thermoanaerobaculia bacterium]|nr:single-stranded-DNA-specific exonuclease RecJ [Thermoanaerobaculia bacterium]
MTPAPPAPPETLAPGRGLSGPSETMSRVGIGWELARIDPIRRDALAREAGVSSVTAALLLRRGVEDGEAARRFLHPREDGLHDPTRLKGADEAADLLISTARRSRRVVVFGDYDVDGVTAVAQLRAALGRIGADAVPFIPHRLRDGYGLKPATVRKVIDELRPAAIITVDCGIGAVEGVACARAAGVDVVVTDHHLVPAELPSGAVVVNPRQPGCGYPYKELAACSVAMKIAEAVGRRSGRPVRRESLLRAACLGTIADLVPLEGENRVIAALGLAALAAARAPGLRALLLEAGLPAGSAPTSEDVAFRVGPRLNAAGRLDTAMLALSLFEERDPSRAGEVARELSARNAERQALERHVVIEARRRIGPAPDETLLVEADPEWHRGVLGIAASRLAREYHRPVLLFGMEGERASGSGRSIPGVSLHGILKELSARFTDFGGHDQAVGGTLPAAAFEAFRSDARALFRERVPREVLAPRAEADAELPLDAVDEELVRELARLEPHGAGNPKPVFLARGAESAGAFSPVGAAGLRGRLRSRRGGIRAIAWQPQADLEGLFASGRPLDLHYRLVEDRRGYGLQAEIVRARPAETAS